MAELNPILAAIQHIAGQGGNAPIPGLPGAPFMPDTAQGAMPPGAITQFPQQQSTVSENPMGGQQIPFDELALQQLMGAQQPQKEKTWSDTGKELMAPLAVGLLSSLIHPRLSGALGGIKQGIDAGLNYWERQKQWEQQNRAAAARNAAARAAVLARMGSTQATEKLRQAQMEQTGELTRERLGERREEVLSREQMHADTLAQQAANAAQVSADKRFAQMEENRRAAEHNDLMRYLKSSSGGGPPVKVIDLKTGQIANVSREDSKDATRYHPFTAQEAKDISTLNKADSALGGLSEALDRMKDKPDSSWLGKNLDYQLKYKLMGGAGLSDEKMNLMSWIDLAQQQFIGAAGTMSGSRAARMLMMMTNHLPKQQDSIETIKSKVKTMKLAMDLAKDAEGYGGNLIQDPAGLAAAKKQMKISQDASEAEYQQKFGQYLQEKYGAEVPPAAASTSAPAPAAADPYSGVDWDALEKKHPKSGQ